MKNGLRLLTAASLFALAPTLALASPTSSGIYLGANFGGTYANVADIFDDGSTTTTGGFGANANLGYQFNNWFGVEGGFSIYTDLGLFNKNLYSGHLAGKLMIPFTDRFNIFFKLGAAIIGAESQSQTFGALFFAGGLAFAVTNQLDILVQTSGVTQGLFTVGLYSAGLTYHFKM